MIEHAARFSRHGYKRDDGVTAVANALKSNTTLTVRLSLARNGISYHGATAIAKFLPVNFALTHIILSNNWIGDSGAIAIATGLRTNTALRCLELNHSSICNPGGTSILNALRVTNSMSPFNTTLASIGLYGNTISVKILSNISKALRTNGDPRWKCPSRPTRMFILVTAYVRYVENPPATSFWGPVRNQLDDP
jgi:Leucine Rich repeat